MSECTRCKAASSVGRVLKKCADRDPENISDVIEPLEQQPTLAVLNMDEHIPRDARFKRQRFLGQSPREADAADTTAYFLAALGPQSGSFGICLTGSGWHATQ